MAVSYELWVNSAQLPNAAVESVNFERERSDIFNRLSSGECSFVLDASKGDFTTGTLALRINQPVNFRAVDGSSVYNLFTGFVEQFQLNPAVGEQKMVVNCGDISARLRRIIQTSLQVYVDQATVFNNILQAAQFSSSQYIIGSMPEAVAFAFQDQISAGDAINEIQKAGASFVFVDGSGRLNIANRNFDVLSSTAIYSLASFLELTLARKVGDIVNDCTVRVTPRASGLAISTVGGFYDSLFVAGLSSASVTIEFVDGNTNESGAPVFSVNDPVANVDFKLTEGPGGIGPDVSSQCTLQITTFARSAVISVFNNGTRNAYLHGLTLFGNPASKLPDVVQNQKDQASINSYQVAAMDIKADILQTPDYARGLSSYILFSSASPSDELTVTIKNKMPQILETEINQHVFISNSLLGVNSSFVVKSVSHEISFDAGVEHFLTLGLGLRPSKNFFILDSSVQGRLTINRLGL